MSADQSGTLSRGKQIFFINYQPKENFKLIIFFVWILLKGECDGKTPYKYFIGKIIWKMIQGPKIIDPP